MYRLTVRFFALCLIWVVISFQAHAAVDEQSEYTVGVVPQHNPYKTYKKWAPFTRQLEADTGIVFKLNIYNNFNDFLNDLRTGLSDFLYLAPYHLVLANREQGYIPIMRSGNRKLTGILVATTDSDVHDISDLAGRVIAFPSPNAFAASVYIRSKLDQRGMNYTPKFVSSHDNVYRSVVLHKADVGGGVTSTFDAQPGQLRSKLKIIYKTDSVISHPFAAHPRVPENIVKRITDTIDGYQKNHADLLMDIKLDGPISTNYGEYRFLEEMDLEKYMTQ